MKTVRRGPPTTIVHHLKPREIRLSKTGRRMRYDLSYALAGASFAPAADPALILFSQTRNTLLEVLVEKEPGGEGTHDVYLPFPILRLRPPIKAVRKDAKGKGLVKVALIVICGARWVGAKRKNSQEDIRGRDVI